MLEKDIENLIAAHPEDVFPGEGFRLIAQQHTIEGKRIDILFEDRLKRQVIVEVKRGILNREAAGQIAEYYGLLKIKNPDLFVELILCANVIPKERKMFLEMTGIACKELGLSFITELAKKYDYTFLDDRPSYRNRAPTKRYATTTTNSEDHSISVWLFQANPERYDILNALSAPELGNSISWLVSRYRSKIQKGHLALIWMSGKDAGIYALARVDSDPTHMKESHAESRFWLSPNEKEEMLRVKLTILSRMVNKPIFKHQLKALNELSELSILRQAAGTNFPVKDNEWKIISQLL